MLDEEGLVDFLECVLLFGKRGGKGVKADWTSFIFFDDGHEQTAVELVEAVGVHFEHFEGVFGGCAVDFAGAANLSVIANAAQEAVGDARSSAGTHGDFGSSWGIDGNVEDFGRALDDGAEIFVGVELQTQEDSEAGAQGRGQQAGARGGTDEGEGLDVHDMRARGGTLADDDVELIVLERGVEFFFEDRLEAMDFVEEEHLALADVSEDGGEIALNLQGRASRLLKTYIQLVCNDSGERGFA